MLTALLQIHRTLAYLVFLLALVDLGLVLSKARTDPRIATVLHWTHKSELMLGRVAVVAGLGLFAMIEKWPITTWWVWVSLLLWVPVEIVAKRLVSAEVALVRDSGTASGRLAVGAVVELACITVIFGLMSAHPG